MVNFQDMSEAELKVYAKEKSVDIKGAKSKIEIIGRIAEAESAQPQPVDFDVMGVKGTIDISLFDDAEVFEWMGDIQDGNAFVYPKLCKRLFGDEWAEIARKLKGDRPRLTASRMVTFFTELMTEADAKN